MYAAGTAHPLRDPCRRALRRALDMRVRLVTDAEVLQEILHRYFSLRRRDAAQTVFRSAVDLCAEVLPVEERHAERALELLLDRPEISPRDALHVAVVEAAGGPAILSTDTDFDAIDTVQRIDPRAFLL